MQRMKVRVDNEVGQSKMITWSMRLAETQWKFVGRLKQLPTTSWPSQVAFWQPYLIDDPSCDFIPHRGRGRPCIRWDDEVSNFSWWYFGQRWQDVPHLSFWRALPEFLNS